MKIYLSGTFGERKNAEIVKKIPYILESFYYIKEWQMPLIKTAKDFLLDSGAFTFFSKKSIQAAQFDEYLERYADFIKRNDIRHFFELDVDSMVGYEKVLQYRSRLEKLTARQCIPVWHIERGKDEFLRHCDEYPCVALGGYVTAIKTSDPRLKAYVKAYTWFINEAHKRGAQIHGLGFTRVNELEKNHFDSVDSTRWNCARFGRLEYFDGKTMQKIDKRKDGKRLKGRSGDMDTIAFTLTEWIKYQNYAETHL